MKVELSILKEILLIGIPSILFNVFFMGQQVINYAFIGKVYDDDIMRSAMGVSNIFYSCVTLACVNGFSEGFNILGSNAIGVRNYKLFGFVYQRAKIVVYFFGLFAFFINFFLSRSFFSFLFDDAQLLDYIDTYLKLLSFAIFFHIEFRINIIYLNIAEHGLIYILSALVSIVVHIFLNYIFLIRYDLGVAGAALAEFFSQFINAFVSWYYVNKLEPIKGTIFPFSAESFDNLYEYLSISVPSLIVTSFETLSFESLAMIGVVLGPHLYSAHIAVTQIVGMIFMIVMGISPTITILSGKYIADKNIEMCVKCIKVGIVFTMVVMSLLSFLIVINRESCAGLFTEKEDLIEIVSNVILYYPILLLTDVMSTLMGATLRGINKQTEAMFVNIFSFPLQVVLAYYFAVNCQMEVAGLWVAFFFSTFFNCLGYGLIYLRSDLKRIAEIVNARANYGKPKELEKLLDDVDF